MSANLKTALKHVLLPHYTNIKTNEVVWLTRRGKYLGNGAYGSVIGYGENVAIKTFKKEKSYQKELDILQNLSSIPNYENYCVKLLGTRKPMSIAVERAEMSLNNLIKHYNYDCKYIARQLIAAVNFIHLNGIVHLDIKPDNVLVFDNQKIKLADFGMSMNVKEQSAIEKYKLTDGFVLNLKESTKIPIGTMKYEPIEIVIYSIKQEYIKKSKKKFNNEIKDKLKKEIGNGKNSLFKYEYEDDSLFGKIAKEYLLPTEYDLRCIDAWSTMCTLYELQFERPLFAPKSSDACVEMYKQIRNFYEEEQKYDVAVYMKECCIVPEIRLECMIELYKLYA